MSAILNKRDEDTVDADVLDSIYDEPNAKKPSGIAQGIYTYENPGSLDSGPYYLLSPGEPLDVQGRRVADPESPKQEGSELPESYAQVIKPGGLFRIVNSGEWVDGRYIEGGHYLTRYKVDRSGNRFLREGPTSSEKAVPIYASAIRRSLLEAHGETNQSNPIGVISDVGAFAGKPEEVVSYHHFNWNLYPVVIEPGCEIKDESIPRNLREYMKAEALREVLEDQGGLAARRWMVEQFRKRLNTPSFSGKYCPGSLKALWREAVEQILQAYNVTKSFLDMQLSIADRSLAMQEKNAVGKAMYDHRDFYAMWLLKRKGIDSALTEIVNRDPQINIQMPEMPTADNSALIAAMQAAVSTGIAEGMKAVAESQKPKEVPKPEPIKVK